MAAGGMLSAVLCLTAAGCRSLLCNGVDSLVERGDLLSARRTAALGAAEEGCMEHCAGRWRRGIESLRRHPDWRDRVRDAHREAAAPPPLASVRRCWGPVRGEWHRRCSSSSAAAARAAAECCAVGNGSWSYLALPAVRETEVLVQLPSSALLRIQQDGVLRLFASDGVLWPAGFLLALWLSSRCWRWAGREILELGAGTGVASIAAALCGARVTAADKEFTSAATTLANAAAAGAESVAVLQYDWSTDQALPRRSYPVVVGASLLFEGWAGRMWGLLRNITDRRGTVVLVHTAGDLRPPDDFVTVGRLSGDAYGMKTAHGDVSDFELIELRR